MTDTLKEKDQKSEKFDSRFSRSLQRLNMKFEHIQVDTDTYGKIDAAIW